MSVSEQSGGAINPVIHLIFARGSVILVCQPLGKYNLKCTVLCYIKRKLCCFQFFEKTNAKGQKLKIFGSFLEEFMTETFSFEIN